MADAFRQHTGERRGDQRTDEGGEHQQDHQRQAVGDTVACVGLGLGLAMEDDEDQAEGVDRGQEGTGQARVEQGGMATGEGFPEDLVLGVEARGDQWQGRQG
ncbi:hypothetical protein D9M71_738780 [compost metagenome]